MIIHHSVTVDSILIGDNPTKNYYMLKRVI